MHRLRLALYRLSARSFQILITFISTALIGACNLSEGEKLALDFEDPVVLEEISANSESTISFHVRVSSTPEIPFVVVLFQGRELDKSIGVGSFFPSIPNDGHIQKFTFPLQSIDTELALKVQLFPTDGLDYNESFVVWLTDISLK